MQYQDMYWHLFIQSGDPDAYLAFKRQHMMDSAARHGSSGSGSGNSRFHYANGNSFTGGSLAGGALIGNSFTGGSLTGGSFDGPDTPA